MSQCDLVTAFGEAYVNEDGEYWRAFAHRRGGVTIVRYGDDCLKAAPHPERDSGRPEAVETASAWYVAYSRYGGRIHLTEQERAEMRMSTDVYIDLCSSLYADMDRSRGAPARNRPVSLARFAARGFRGA